MPLNKFPWLGTVNDLSWVLKTFVLYFFRISQLVFMNKMKLKSCKKYLPMKPLYISRPSSVLEVMSKSFAFSSGSVVYSANSLSTWVLGKAVISTYNEFITCYHESWIYETWIVSMKFVSLFRSVLNGFKNQSRIIKNQWNCFFFSKRQFLSWKNDYK